MSMRDVTASGRRVRLLAQVVVVAALLAGSVACGADPDDSLAARAGASGEPAAVPEIVVPEVFEDHTGATTVEIALRDNLYEPRHLRVDAGVEVFFVHEGRNQHDVLPGVVGAFEAIDAEQIPPGGGRAAVVFDEPGAYPFYCSFHGTATFGQTGYLLVE
jgi:plastocyanin